MSISVVINTKNMASSLEVALKSVQSFADEVVVVDMKSNDGTVGVAEKFGAHVFHYDKDLGFADPARNFALSKAKSDWMFVLDADEEVPAALGKLVKQIVAGEVESQLQGDCYFIPRQNVIFGQALQHTGWWPDYQPRFFKKGFVRWTDKVHTPPEVSGKVIHLPADAAVAIVHQNYQTIQQFIDRLNRYTDVESKRRGDLSGSSVIPAQSFTPTQIFTSFSAEFFRRLFAEEGIEDGTHGLSLSLLQSFYELAVKLKQWQLAQFVEVESAPQSTIMILQNFQKDLSYWIADWQVRHTSGFSRLVWKFRRKWATRTQN